MLQEERMKKSLLSLGESFNTIRTGRANPAILDKIMVSLLIYLSHVIEELITQK
jgi:ribosome recycling factor